MTRSISFLALALLGCAEVPPSGPFVCTLGESRACACPTGETGAQVCEDGERLGACVCSDDDGGYDSDAGSAVAVDAGPEDGGIVVEPDANAEDASEPDSGEPDAGPPPPTCHDFGCPDGFVCAGIGIPQCRRICTVAEGCDKGVCTPVSFLEPGQGLCGPG